MAKKFWLVKVPDFLAENWKNQKDGTNIGYLEIDKKKKTNKKTNKNSNNNSSNRFEQDKKHIGKFYLNDVNINVNNKQKEVPKKYFLIKREQQISDGKKLVFSDKKDKIKMENFISVVTDIKPSLEDKSYKNILIDRFSSAFKRKRTTATISKTKILQLSRPDVSSFIGSKRKRDRESTKRNKRTRMDQEALKEMILGLFDKKDYYDIDELIEETSQPAGYLKKTLSLVCKFDPVRKYSLKPEYRIEYEEEEE